MDAPPNGRYPNNYKLRILGLVPMRSSGVCYLHLQHAFALEKLKSYC